MRGSILNVAFLSLFLTSFAFAAEPDAPAPPKAEDLKAGLRATIYSDNKFEHPVKSRIDPNVDFNFGIAGPDPATKSDHYSIRWVGWLKVNETGEYLVGFHVDDSVKFYLDNKLLMSFSSTAKGKEVDKKMQLIEGLHFVKIDYANNNGPGQIQWHWTPNQGQKSIVPANNLFYAANK